jgi:hypothetical protein
MKHLMIDHYLNRQYNDVDRFFFNQTDKLLVLNNLIFFILNPIILIRKLIESISKYFFSVEQK